MAHITNKLRGLVAAFVAVFAALALVPGVAQAAEWTGADDTSTISVTGLHTNDKVEFILVASIDVDDNNQTFYTPSANFSEGAAKTYIDSDGTAADADTLVNAMVASPAIADTKVVAESANSVTSVQLPAGLYYARITPADGADYVYQKVIVSLEPKAVHGTTDWTIDPISVPAKVTSTTVTKTVTDLEGNTVASAKPGEQLKYTISFNIGEGLKDFTVTDTMTGAELDEGSLSVHVTDENGEDVAPSNYTLTPADNGHGFTLEFTSEFLETVKADTTYVAVYTATVCKHNTVEAGVVNNASTSTGGKDDVKTPFGHAGVYKVDEEGHALPGAVFKLVDANGDAITDINGDEVIITAGEDGFAWTDDDNIDVLLKIGDQVYFEEVSAPSGYKKMEGLTKPATVVALDDESQVSAITVENKKSGKGEGLELPTTGGMGTVALTAAGVVLVAGAAAFIVRSRKQN